MKRVKPILPSFDQESLPKKQCCEYVGCALTGEFKAPRNRHNLKDYIWLCLMHVREYNAKWNYYTGMSAQEIEQEIRFDETWQRPTWPFSQKIMHYKMERIFYDSEEKFPPFKNVDKGETNFNVGAYKKLSEIEKKAVTVMRISYPFDRQTLKKTYLALAKKYHPDANGGLKEAEEYLKEINQAYEILKKLSK